MNKLQRLKATRPIQYADPGSTCKVVTSLETLRQYIGPQPLAPTPSAAEMEAKAALTAAAASARADEERLVFAHGTFNRFAEILRLLDVPYGSTEDLLRDEILTILAEHGHSHA